MRRSFLLPSVVLFASLGVTWAGQDAQENSDKSKTADYKITPEDAARVNPVKSSPARPWRT